MHTSLKNAQIHIVHIKKGPLKIFFRQRKKAPFFICISLSICTLNQTESFVIWPQVREIGHLQTPDTCEYT